MCSVLRGLTVTDHWKVLSFCILRRLAQEQARVKHPIDYTPLTDRDIEHIYNGARVMYDPRLQGASQPCS